MSRQLMSGERNSVCGVDRVLTDGGQCRRLLGMELIKWVAVRSQGV